MTSRRSFLARVGGCTAAAIVPAWLYSHTPRCKTPHSSVPLPERAVERCTAQDMSQEAVDCLRGTATEEERGEGLMMAMMVLQSAAWDLPLPHDHCGAWARHYVKEFRPYAPLTYVCANGGSERLPAHGPYFRYWQDLYRGVDPETGKRVLIGGVMWMEAGEGRCPQYTFMLHRPNERRSAVEVLRAMLPGMHDQGAARQIIRNIEEYVEAVPCGLVLV